MLLNNYSIFKNEMILRDYLALDRTVLANERTLLSYLRTFVGAFSAGVAMVKLFDTLFTTVTGYIFIIVSPVFIIAGTIRYIQIAKKLKSLKTAGEITKKEEAVA